MLRVLMIFLAVTALSSCASSAGYKEVVESWVGSTETALVQSWGPPDQVYSAPDGSRILTYYSQRNIMLPGSAPTYQTTVIGNTAYTTSSGGRAPSNLAMSCETSFTVRNNKITYWRFQGNDCRA